MREGMLHIRDVEGSKKTRSVETRLEAMEQQVFKCQEMVERGLNANHMMITEFTNKHWIDANDIGKHLSRLYDRIDQLQGQIYDMQNQNCATNPTPRPPPVARFGRGTRNVTRSCVANPTPRPPAARCGRGTGSGPRSGARKAASGRGTGRASSTSGVL
ncbi:40S ribosomal protein S5-1 [Hordeum vulgare]|nr:40S ribosomal protein S5-1 [Hordeum vulgare]